MRQSLFALLIAATATVTTSATAATPCTDYQTDYYQSAEGVARGEMIALVSAVLFFGYLAWNYVAWRLDLRREGLTPKTVADRRHPVEY